MPLNSRQYFLGRNCQFSAISQMRDPTVFRVANDDVIDVTLNFETGNEAELTTRGSGVDQEFVPVHRNTTVEVKCSRHTLAHHEVVQLTIQPPAGAVTGRTLTNYFYLANESQPEVIDGAVVHTLLFRRTVGNAFNIPG